MTKLLTSYLFIVSIASPIHFLQKPKQSNPANSNHLLKVTINKLTTIIYEKFYPTIIYWVYFADVLVLGNSAAKQASNHDSRKADPNYGAAI